MSERLLNPPNNVFFGCGEEMLRLSRDGFYVRGVKVPQDADEALKVYDAFILWMNEYTQYGNKYGQST